MSLAELLVNNLRTLSEKSSKGNDSMMLLYKNPEDDWGKGILKVHACYWPVLRKRKVKQTERQTAAVSNIASQSSVRSRAQVFAEFRIFFL